MRETDLFWDASFEELKHGYIEEKNRYRCLLCNELVEKGVIYPYKGMFYEAERFMHIHIEEEHISVFAYLLGMDKKFTGLTEHQTELLQLFYEGKSDKEVQEALAIGSASTIRHHRFSLKEKERQAKVFLTMMSLLKEKDTRQPAFIPPHKTATMVDDRYAITIDEEQEVLRKFLPNGVQGGLNRFPSKEKQRLIIMREIAHHLEDKQYTEKQLNELLSIVYEDYALLRRYLVDYGFLDRKQDGSKYWLKK